MNTALTDKDLEQLLNPPKGEPSKITLHYTDTRYRFAPALCGQLPSKEGWDRDYAAAATAGTGSKPGAVEVCPACQVRISYPHPPQYPIRGTK